MTFSVELATVLAQTLPVFLLMLMFERFYFGRAEREVRARWVRFGHLVRYVATMLCFLLFVVSMVVVGFGQPLHGGIAIAAVVVLGFLAYLLWGALDLSLSATYQRAVENAEADSSDEEDDTDPGGDSRDVH